MSEYVKTEWQTGDIITAEKLNNIEDGIANAGGGDTITATMSFTSDPDGLAVVVATPMGLEMVNVMPTAQEYELIGTESALILPYGMYTDVTGAEPYGEAGFLSVLDGATIVFS